MTLTETASLTKKVLVVAFIFLAISSFGWIGYRAYRNYQISKIPPPEEKPEVKWGILPKPTLITTPVSASNYVYSLDTATGGLPEDLPKFFKVYFVPQTGTTLLASDRARDLARKFDFNDPPQPLTPTTYRFTDTSGSELIINLNTGSFKLRRPAATESADIADLLPNKEQIKTEYLSFLSSKNLLKEQLENGRTQIFYDQPSQRESNSARITLWQNDVDNVQIITPQFTTGLVNAVVTKERDEKQKYTSLDYVVWPVDTTQSSTYPLKPVTQAFEDLKAGKGVIVIEPARSRVSLTKVTIVYLLPEDYPQYLQPVYLFEGDQFAAMTPAIADEYLEK